MGSKLTDKQEKFVQGLLRGLSQRQAYKESYNAKNMKDNTIDRRASELFNKGVIKARYDQLHKKLAQKAEEEGLLSATDVLRKLTELIIRNENIDDRVALDGIKTYAKKHGLLTEKVEVTVKEMPEIKLSK